jgi:hypothetical protein
VNEDDTARKLRRIDFLDLVFKINALPDDECELYKQNIALRREWLDRYGWTNEEVEIALTRYFTQVNGH